jgi:RNA polymerase sigma factor for flagellar operon FliA
MAEGLWNPWCCEWEGLAFEASAAVAEAHAHGRRRGQEEKAWELLFAAEGSLRRWSDFDTLPEEPEGVLVVNSYSSGSYASLRADAATTEIVAFDAEWVPDWTSDSDNPISVLQLAFPSSRRVYVLQLGPLGGLPQAVQTMLVNPEVLKVGFAVDHADAAKMSRSGIAVTSSSVVDVQGRCEALLGGSWAGRALSLKRAARCLLGYALDKDRRWSCSNWACAKLTPEQIRYAALDAWVALRLYYIAY